MSNPLICDRDVGFILYDVLRVLELTRLPHFAEHDRTTFDIVIDTARRFARDVSFAAYKPMDEQPARLVAGQVEAHPRMKALYPALSALGLVVASRPAAVGGQQLPGTVVTMASAYLMAANSSAFAYVGLAAGAAHLLESFGSDVLRETYMAPLYEGRWLGTMALTEPHAGSSLADVTTRATPLPDGSYSIRGSKIFISGGDHDVTENIVHLVLGRIEGAPLGSKGLSLFCVPKYRADSGAWVDNDVRVTGVLHKIGWRGLPSVALAFGEKGECRGHLVGAANKGLAHMFQMMNQARIMVGINGVALASVAYQEALEYAKTRVQGRHYSERDASAPQVPIIEHADVRRMLLRQKAIVEGGLCLVARTAHYADLADYAEDEAARQRARMLLDLLTPIAKSFPAERGFEANVLALQVHGGYGYTSEYLPESWLREQKLNSLHEGTTGIQALDLLGRKAVAGGGAALVALRQEFEQAAKEARASGVAERLVEAVLAALSSVEALTFELGAKGLAGDVPGMLLHSSDYLEIFSILTVSWQHLAMMAAAQRALTSEPEEPAFYRGKLLAGEYWIATELGKLEALIRLCKSAEDSYARARPEDF
jgi:alkylation response protein AidB-like acyl-CoA dehydrogenase